MLYDMDYSKTPPTPRFFKAAIKNGVVIADDAERRESSSRRSVNITNAKQPTVRTPSQVGAAFNIKRFHSLS